jgi:predicted signal transduction protein with EAL and GGDEF domain
VKIDRSFLQGIGTDKRSLNRPRSVARLSADLGMAVEGIETEEQLALVAQETGIEATPMRGSDVRDVLGCPRKRPSLLPVGRVVAQSLP